MSHLIWFRDFAYKWAGFWVMFVTVLAVFTFYQGRHTDLKFEALRGGICKLVVVSNKAVPKNRAIYLGAIDRGLKRYHLDLAAGHTSLAQLDLDGVHANQRALARTHTFSLAGC